MAGQAASAHLLVPALQPLTCYNLGVRADTLALIHKRWRIETDARFKTDQTGLIFCFGTADVAQGVPRDQSIENCRRILDEAQELAPTLLLTPPPVLNPDSDTLLGRLAEAFRAEAQQRGVPVLDLHTALAGSSTYKTALKRNDGVHPSASGYEELAGLLRDWSPMKTLLTSF